MKSPLKPVVGSIIIIAILAWLLTRLTPTVENEAQLTLYCAAGIKSPIERIATQYEEEYGTKIQIEYGGSGSLLSRIEISPQGDLYLAADSSYTDIAYEKDLVAERLPVANIKPVIAVPKGNPKNIQQWQDLSKNDLRLALANPEAASVGKTTKKLLESIGHWESIKKQTESAGVFKPTVNDVANDIKIGTVDAGIVWDATVAQYPELEAIALPESDTFKKNIMLGVLKASTKPTAALRFARYITAQDRGLTVFEEENFPPVQGDQWAVRPEITYYAGGVNRIAIEETLAEFSEREGVDITTIYNGCGILLGQIKTGGRPDVYHTCDVSFMKGVEDLFGDVRTISSTDIVILTQKDNPKNIQTLNDMGKEGLSIGLCNEDLSTLGTLTAKLLKEVGAYESVKKNVVVSNPQGDFLVTQLTLGKLDAAVVYYANTKFKRDVTEQIPINLDRAVAKQTYTVANETPYPNLLERLHDAINSKVSKDRFLDAGFDYLAETML